MLDPGRSERRVPRRRRLDYPRAMWVSKVSELIGSSPISFEEAAREVVMRANRTLRGITGIQVVEKRIKVEGDRIAEYRVRLRLSFEMAPERVLHW
jgi:flavin-binding protein dodecin